VLDGYGLHKLVWDACDERFGDVLTDPYDDRRTWFWAHYYADGEGVTASSTSTIYADASWALPTSGIPGSQCFYSCSTSLVGGNGTTWASNKTAYTYFRIDTASTPGYITAA
jgi:hypothetical protein